MRLRQTVRETFKRKSVSVCKRQREERGRKTKERDRERNPRFVEKLCLPYFA